MKRAALAKNQSGRAGRRLGEMSKPYVPAICLTTFLAVWVALAIEPSYRDDWFLENLPTMLAVPLAVFTYRRFRFSDRAYIQATLFAILHTIGSHYTYSEVPAGEWIRDALDLSRNHYDRIVHFAFGLLILRPLQELSLPQGFSGWNSAYLGLGLVAFWSVLYELVEWVVAAIVDPAAGTAFLGTQGDVWDAQKDMALALAGALLAILVDRLTASKRRSAAPDTRNSLPRA